MDIFEILSRESQTRNLPFLVIGGHAVVVHGFSRTTADLDLLVRNTQRADWLKLFNELRFTVFNDGGNFLQLSPPKDAPWPLDLMLVNDESFAGMLAEAVEAKIAAVPLKVPSLRHLLALKLHALKNGPPHRIMKDTEDVASLIQTNRLDIRDAKLRELMLKYGTPELYERFVQMCGQG